MTISLTVLLFLITSLVQGADKNPSYDSIPITPKTWQEVDLSYHDIINGKSYPALIQLLRPITWLKTHGMHKVGNNVTLSIPEFGINAVYAKVTSIKPTNLNTANIDWSKRDTRPVIGKFKRYAPVVKTYTFKNLTTGKINTISATPNHPFYVNNKKAFVPIEDVSPRDQLFSASGQQINLICLPNQTNHCGKRYNRNGSPVSVYNLEIYRKHVYYVGYDKIFVHNVCLTSDEKNLISSNKTFMPESALQAQKNAGMELFYRTELGSRYFYNFDDATPFFRRIISDERAEGRAYNLLDIKSNNTLVSSYSQNDYLIIKKSLPNEIRMQVSKIRSVNYALLDRYFVGFEETDIPGLYRKNYSIAGNIYSIEHDALFRNTAFEALDTTNTIIHAGDRIIFSQFF